MIRAIYKRREDGDYDFVAAFETDLMPAPPSNWPEEILEYLNAEGELPLVLENVALHHLPDVWTPTPKQRRQEIANVRHEPRGGQGSD
jgi:hypothetical protein